MKKIKKVKRIPRFVIGQRVYILDRQARLFPKIIELSITGIMKCYKEGVMMQPEDKEVENCFFYAFDLHPNPFNVTWVPEEVTFISREELYKAL